MTLETRKTIEDAAQGSLDGTLSFPDVVGRLMEVGVTRYFVDFVRAEKVCYLGGGEWHAASLPMPESDIASEFSAVEMAANVRSSQQDGQSYPAFLERSFQAGCVGYFAYLDGRKVVYLGAKGEEHVEHFPD